MAGYCGKVWDPVETRPFKENGLDHDVILRNIKPYF